MASILVVDDDPGIVELFTDLCEAAGIKVYAATSGSQALTMFTNNPCDFLLTDIIMPGGVDGLEVILAIKEINPDVEVFAMTGDADPSESKGYLDAAELFGASEVFQKPLNPQTVIDKIKAS